jgi:ubiquinone/menaquinone biosynthesis C-methylase UbiE
MSLLDVDEFEGAVAEAARVLHPDGVFCIAIAAQPWQLRVIERADRRASGDIALALRNAVQISRYAP